MCEHVLFLNRSNYNVTIEPIREVVYLATLYIITV